MPTLIASPPWMVFLAISHNSIKTSLGEPWVDRSSKTEHSFLLLMKDDAFVRGSRRHLSLYLRQRSALAPVSRSPTFRQSRLFLGRYLVPFHYSRTRDVLRPSLTSLALTLTRKPITARILTSPELIQAFLPIQRITE